MKTIGMIGGMSWESTVSYYQIINRAVKQRLGGLHSARCLLHSVEFDEVERMQTEGRWQEAGGLLQKAARGLEAAGADCMLICTNTMHKVANAVQAGITVPLLHIADATADALLAAGVTTAALLGTRYTMEQDFYTKRLENKGITPLVPGKAQRTEINCIIFEELCRGQVLPASKTFLLGVIGQLAARGAGGVILGCTEIGLLVHQADTGIKLFDTTEIHALAAVDFALA